jgi:hypothetical protein
MLYLSLVIMQILLYLGFNFEGLGCALICKFSNDLSWHAFLHMLIKSSSSCMHVGKSMVAHKTYIYIYIYIYTLPTTLPALTVITLFSEVLKFSKNFFNFPNLLFSCKGKYWFFKNILFFEIWKLENNSLFDRHVLNLLQYYKIYIYHLMLNDVWFLCDLWCTREWTSDDQSQIKLHLSVLYGEWSCFFHAKFLLALYLRQKLYTPFSRLENDKLVQTFSLWSVVKNQCNLV